MYIGVHSKCTKFDIYVFITITGSIPLLILVLGVSSAQKSVFRHWHGLLDIIVIEILNNVNIIKGKVLSLGHSTPASNTRFFPSGIALLLPIQGSFPRA